MATEAEESGVRQKKTKNILSHLSVPLSQREEDGYLRQKDLIQSLMWQNLVNIVEREGYLKKGPSKNTEKMSTSNGKGEAGGMNVWAPCDIIKSLALLHYFLN
ncbi:hypothetical protein YC2023_096485 [Brassica napus]